MGWPSVVNAPNTTFLQPGEITVALTRFKSRTVWRRRCNAFLINRTCTFSRPQSRETRGVIFLRTTTGQNSGGE